MKAKEKFIVSEALIGKYINQYLWSDARPVGKIVGIKGKTKVLVQPVVASENLTQMEFVVGGFAGHCTNQYEQKYEFSEQGKVFELSLSNSKIRRSHLGIADAPCRFYDYNF
jgi:hypothetical protein